MRNYYADRGPFTRANKAGVLAAMALIAANDRAFWHGARCCVCGASAEQVSMTRFADGEVWCVRCE